ncbi:MAG: hypothetical protein AAF598_01810 [Bacteroidota bacterium]
MESLSIQLEKWTNLDIAMHLLTVQLGLIEDYPGAFQKEYKWMY